MKSRRQLPCILAIEFYLIVCGVSIAYSVMRAHGHFLYPLDDTYISMDIAKNLAQHAVMGLTRYGFSFSSSCPLWIWLIALVDAVTGSAWWTPLLLGLTAGLAVVLLAYRILERNHAASTAGLLALIVLAPLPAMALSGMEHALHIALVLWFVSGACEWVADDSQHRGFAALAAVVPFLVMTRYESLFLAGIFALLLAARRKWLHAAAILFLAVAPVVLLGMFAVSKGWEWLPNSLLLKGNVPDLSLWLEC